MWTFWLDLLFPPFCTGCGRFGTLLCEHCYEEIEFSHTPLRLNLVPLFLDGCIAMAEYTFPIPNLLHSFKYQSVKAIGPLLAAMIYHTTPLPPDCVLTAVPLHARRLDERGFNQAEVIGKHLAKLMSVPYLSLLSRAHYTTPQAQIKNRTQRLTHLNHTFILEPNAQVATTTRKVIVIDDVTTTGTTLNECARVLKSAGWKEIYGLTIAHGA